MEPAPARAKGTGERVLKYIPKLTRPDAIGFLVHADEMLANPVSMNSHKLMPIPPARTSAPDSLRARPIRSRGLG